MDRTEEERYGKFVGASSARMEKMPQLGSGKNRKSRLCGGPEAEARWLRCPLARESD